MYHCAPMQLFLLTPCFSNLDETQHLTETLGRVTINQGNNDMNRLRYNTTRNKLKSKSARLSALTKCNGRSGVGSTIIRVNSKIESSKVYVTGLKWEADPLDAECVPS